MRTDRLLLPCDVEAGKVLTWQFPSIVKKMSDGEALLVTECGATSALPGTDRVVRGTAVVTKHTLTFTPARAGAVIKVCWRRLL